MIIRQKIIAAIRKVGATAYLPGENTVGFPASVQPILSNLEEQVDSLGWGVVRRFMMYAPCGTTADQLVEGDVIAYLGSRYQVRRLDIIYFGHEALYLQGRLQLEEEVV